MFRRLIQIARASIGFAEESAQSSEATEKLDAERARLKKGIDRINRGIVEQAKTLEDIYQQVSRLEQAEKEEWENARKQLLAGQREPAAEAAFAVERTRKQLHTLRSLLSDAKDTMDQLDQARNKAVAEARQRMAAMAKLTGDSSDDFYETMPLEDATESDFQSLSDLVHQQKEKARYYQSSRLEAESDPLDIELSSSPELRELALLGIEAELRNAPPNNP